MNHYSCSNGANGMLATVFTEQSSSTLKLPSPSAVFVVNGDVFQHGIATLLPAGFVVNGLVATSSLTKVTASKITFDESNYKHEIRQLNCPEYGTLSL